MVTGLNLFLDLYSRQVEPGDWTMPKRPVLQGSTINTKLKTGRKKKKKELEFLNTLILLL